MKQERYIPTEDDIKKAEGMMTDEQKEASKIRAKYYEQAQPLWDNALWDNNFEKKYLDESFVRKTPEAKEIKEMDGWIAELGEIFDGSGLNWHLDGALNISLMNERKKNGEINYIGYHKDVDLSVEKNELPELEAHLLKKGYGLFLSRTNAAGKNKIMRRVGYADFHDSPTDHVLIFAMDKNGQLVMDRPLYSFDVHIIERNEAGQALGNSGVVIPEKWAQSYPIEVQGKQINLSHPGKVLYYKLHQSRKYDTTDIERLIKIGKITEEDAADVEKAFESEFSARAERVRTVFEAVAEQLAPGMNADQIFAVMLQQPELKKNAAQIEEILRTLAKIIHESGDMTAEGIIKEVTKLSGMEEVNNKMREEIERIRQLATETQKIQQVKEKIN